MRAPSELKLLRSIKTGKGLIKLIKSLREHSALVGVHLPDRSPPLPLFGVRADGFAV